MRQSTRLLLNSLVSVAGGLVNMAITLVTVPLITHFIGKDAYGVYVLAAGLANYMPFLHAGMSSAVTRYGAAHLARKEYDELNATVNTSIAYYRAIALIFVVFAGVAAWYFTDIFQRVPPNLWHAARWCVLIVGAVEALNLWLGPISGLLWSLERYDLSNLPLVAFRIVRLAALAVLLPRLDPVKGLVVVTAVMLLTNFLPTLVQRMLVLRYLPQLKLDMRLARKRLVMPLVGFGIATLTWHWSQTMLDGFSCLLIGYFLNTAKVGEYQIPCFILLAVHMLVDGSTVVAAPAASRLSSTDRRDDLRTLFLRGSKYAAALSFAGCWALAILAPLVLHLWVGDGFLGAAGVLTLLAVGRSVYYVQTVTYYMLTGMAKQKIPGLMSLGFVGLIVVVQGAVLAWTQWGLVGVAGVTAGGLAIGWGVAMPIYACRQVGVSLAIYWRTILFWPIVACIPASLSWLALRLVPLKYGWVSLFAALGGGGLLACLGWWYLLFDDWDRSMIRERLRGLLDRVRSFRAPSS
jgi:O-antigen/teichoic acid export membrane protein